MRGSPERTAPSQTGGHSATQTQQKNVTHTTGEPKHKHEQQEQATARNRNRSTAPERSALKNRGLLTRGCPNRLVLLRLYEDAMSISSTYLVSVDFRLPFWAPISISEP